MNHKAFIILLLLLVLMSVTACSGKQEAVFLSEAYIPPTIAPTSMPTPAPSETSAPTPQPSQTPVPTETPSVDTPTEQETPVPMAPPPVITPTEKPSATPVEESQNGASLLTVTESTREENELYSIVRYDYSFPANSGYRDVLHYDLLQFNPDLSQFASANAVLKEEYLKYDKSLKERSYDEKEAFYHTIDVTVTNNDGKLLSFKSVTSWFMMDHMTNYHWEGYVYSLESGKRLNWGDIFGDNDQALSTLRSFMTAKIEAGEVAGAYSSAKDRFLDYELSDFRFCVDDGVITLMFDKGKLGPEASGSIFVEFDSVGNYDIQY